ncbi:MAG: hypothetical protein JWQ35_1826 [Bacteriovoracaceae bacterium]|nr:hypothetical protein [Bacteriovoracaceae bacterium]
MRLTKSKYCKGLHCSKALYLFLHHPQLASRPSAMDQQRFDNGNLVGEFARTYFRGGVLIEEGRDDLGEAIQKTLNLIQEQKAPAIFEATFSYQGVLVRVDILENNFDGTWNLFEVKSSTEFKMQYLDDVRVQVWVVEGSGVKIKNAYLRNLNRDARFPDLTELFKDRKVTEAVREKLFLVDGEVKNIVEEMKKGEPPEVKIGAHCLSPYSCEFVEHCWKNIPEGSVLEIANYKKSSLSKYELFDETPLIKDLPQNFLTTPFQSRQWKASQQEGPVFDRKELKRSLCEPQYPFYYFDFETASPPIPLYDGMGPFAKIPAQYSLHIVREPGAPLEHFEFLASGHGDPRDECVESLALHFKNFSGTVIAYHQAFEKSVLKQLAQAFPDHSSFLMNLHEHFWDLMLIFKNIFYHRDFQGSYSIKYVLPYFAPDMEYSKLQIRDGGEAEAMLTKLLRGELTESLAVEVRKNLLAYCAQDTLAMVIIHQKLLELVS